MKQKILYLMIVFGFVTMAQAHVQGVCEDENFASGKFKCWWGTDGSDMLYVSGDEIVLGPNTELANDVSCAGSTKGPDEEKVIGKYDMAYTHVFYGLDGSDEIHGGDLDDWIYGGECNDQIQGGDGNDKIFGENGNDTLYGMDGNDKLIGGEGDDYINGAGGGDELDGGAGNNGLYGGSGVDTIQTNVDDRHIFGDDQNQSGFADLIIIYGGTKTDLIAEFQQDIKDKITYKKTRPH